MPSMFSAQAMSFLPRTMDILADEPAPTREPKACMTFIMGIVMARPAIAMASTPCPRNILSAMLYIEAITWLMTAGRA